MIRILGPVLALLALSGSVAAESLTSLRVIRPQSIIGATDLGLLNAVVPGALSASENVIGLEARVTLYPGRPILPEHVGAPALIERNQPVVVIFRHHSLTISADGRALSRGAVGESVRVMNMASRNTVSGTVQPDGSVVVGSRGIRR